MAEDTWPPALRDWVGRCLAQMTDSNRNEAHAEMKKVISEAFNSRTLWTIDWKTVTLASLEPKAPILGVKRKLGDPGPSFTPKKAKKDKVKLASTNALDTSAEELAKAKRARRFEREHELERQRTNGAYTSLADRVGTLSMIPNRVAYGAKTASKRNMYGRFANEDDGAGNDSNAVDWERFRIVGRSQDLFKHYLRLTSEPDPATIRPKPVLEKTLLELKARWRRESNYQWICDQFKSLRQDLTVQRIKDDFTVSVYEIHARMALESSDLVEFNACIATLWQLYGEGLRGKNEEFLAYRILYLVHAKNRSEINRLIGQLTPEQKAADAVRHALQVQRAIASSNYHALFVLFTQAPNMGGYIMDHIVPRERISALMCMGKVYKPGIPVEFITSELAFENAEETHKFLSDHNAAIYLDDSVPLSQRAFDCKTAFSTLAAEFETKYRKVNIKGSV
ncbi:hypothetical protein EXIGLDRAFT_681609 [Exidia glandulosa HHB12029]|uniref:SAC3/GANP/THP3 conserved domain-containing protein n=1 Tax=Exidia glandulosa HHB12029 TaxID=1314781 RepID=A0A165DZ27_EXIGL|nr:hypothetical protein EXIGLDRAFT_681609 [Exidia glandulosa HHB12029]